VEKSKDNESESNGIDEPNFRREGSSAKCIDRSITHSFYHIPKSNPIIEIMIPIILIYNAALT
jgi:hypothetical protein